MHQAEPTPPSPHVEIAPLAERVALAMAEARRAACEAVASMSDRSELGGAAYVYARKPSIEFREAMFDAGAISESLSGRWPIGRFQDVTDDPSISAAEAACGAALAVLRRHFPEETFDMTSYLT